MEAAKDVYMCKLKKQEVEAQREATPKYAQYMYVK